MAPQEPDVVDRGRYGTPANPWDDPRWRSAALSWIESRLAARGSRPTGPRRVRLRPWSVLVRTTVDGRGPVWFKAAPPAGAFEAGLTAALAGWVPDQVLAPLAVDTRRGWSLLPDGGALFRDVRDDGPPGPRAWEEPLRQYAETQRALVPYAARIGELGVPDGRAGALPGLFDRLVEANGALDGAEKERLRAARPRLVEWCAELSETGIGDSLDHSDLHDGQFFAPKEGRYTFFDWGDALVGHPFSSLLVPLRTARERYGAEVLPRLRDAYLEPWTDAGRRTPVELRRAVDLACRLAAIGRALSWGRLFAGPSEGAAESAYWLRELFAEPPVPARKTG
ncbi:aminoglycoside phosphotransferase family protein [Streptomyces sp. NBC_01498]|uniref:aminoglycoside phosphotransferase family protein n=1 Tax=Streptomyces sp. NBC_01498 TaxID=2975870 RepID=UPI002E7BCA66|nr:aminoglycoside phosphotransferase family protein [Streptomyces sp. NBC_01498]WTL23228.1 aminoglycoside phosphotransferase family protein [Streptomyces sp. NBC_01498]